MNTQAHTDSFTRTDWFDENVDPSIAGPYECTTTTNGGYVCLRVWTGATWISNVTGAPSPVRMPWRGLVPGSIDPMRYPLATRVNLIVVPPAPAETFGCHEAGPGCHAA